MANHGVVTYGVDLLNAYMNMETVEHFAKIALVTHMLGKQQPIADHHVDKLREIRTKYLATPWRTAKTRYLVEAYRRPWERLVSLNHVFPTEPRAS